jgi:Leucine-rich repeat (LRR) protein
MWSLVLFVVVFVGNLGRSDAIRCIREDKIIKPSHNARGILTYEIKNCQREILIDGDTSFEGVQYISADNNLIKSLDNETLKNGENLIHIDLRYNQIRTIQIGTFDKTKKLQNLYLKNNKITNLKPGVFRGLANLKGLWLQGNLIQILEDRLFQDQTDLKEIFFDENQISTIEANVFPNLERVRLVSFNGNTCFNGNYHDITGPKLQQTLIEERKCNEKYYTKSLEICEKARKAIEEEFNEYKKNEKERIGNECQRITSTNIHVEN